MPKLRLSPSGQFLTSLESEDITSIVCFGNNQVAGSTTPRFLEPYFDDATAPVDRVAIINPVGVDAIARRLCVLHNDPGGNGNPVDYTLQVALFDDMAMTYGPFLSSALTVSVNSTDPFGFNLVDTVEVGPLDQLAIIVEKNASIGGGLRDIIVTFNLVPLVE